jgi:hypothetical protein
LTTAAPPQPNSPRSELRDDAAELDLASGEGLPRQARPQRSLNQRLAYWIRWLHLYLSLLSFAALLFFAVTGLTLNHPDWLGASTAHSSAAQGQLPAGLVPTGGAGDEGIRKMELAQFLRSKHAIKGALVELRADDAECTVAFKGPGYSADVTIDRAAATYEVSETRFGLVAVLNDLHKGRDSGGGWSIFIDASAIVMAVVSLSGLCLLFYLKRRLMTGLVTAAVGAGLVYLIYAACVP